MKYKRPTWEIQRRSYKIIAVLCGIMAVFFFLFTPNKDKKDLTSKTMRLVFKPDYVDDFSSKSVKHIIQLNFKEDDIIYEISGADYRLMNHTDFKKEINQGDLVTIFVSGNDIYELEKNGKSYMNLQKSNYYRDKNDIWIFYLGISGLIFSLIPLFLKNEPRIHYEIIFLSGLILTFALLGYFVGWAYVEDKNFK